MAVNLNPGADATLVQAAYAAAMANVPKDLSGTFEALAKNYGETMTTIGKAWGDVAKVGAGFLGEAISNSIELRQKRDLGSTWTNDKNIPFLLDGHDVEQVVEVANPDFDSTLPESETNKKTIEESQVIHIDGLEDIKRKLRAAQTPPITREKRAERIRLKQRRDQIYAQIDMLEAGFGDVATALTNGTYSEGAMNSNVQDSRFLAALSKMSSGQGKAENGDYIKPAYDTDGNLTLNLYDKDGNEVLKNDNTQLSYKASEVNGIMIKDNPEARGAANTLFDGVYKSGTKSSKGTDFTQMGTIFRNQIGELVKTEGSLHSMMHDDKLYSIGSSFVDDLTSESLTSAELFTALDGKIPVDKDNKPIEGFDISGGTDPKAFDEGDIAQNSDNYAKIVSALTVRNNKYYNESTSREAFLDWAQNEAKTVFTNAPRTPSTNIEAFGDLGDQEQKLSGFVNQVANLNQVINLDNEVFSLYGTYNETPVYYTMDEDNELRVMSQYELQAAKGGRFAQNKIGGGVTFTDEERNSIKESILSNPNIGFSSSTDTESLSSLIGEETDDVAVKGLLQGKGFKYKGNKFSFKTEKWDGNYVTASITVDGTEYKKEFKTTASNFQEQLQEFLNNPEGITDYE
jgi:hypothetical protein